MKKQTRSLLIKIVGTIAILGFLVTRIDWDIEEFSNIFSQLNIRLYLLSLTGVILVLGLKSIRWNLLLRAEHCNYPFISAFSAYMSSFTIGLVTPGRIGEIARLYYVRGDRNIDFYHSFKTIITDRIFDFALLVWFGASGLLFFYKVAGDISAFWYLLIIGVLLLIIWFIGTFILNRIHSEKKYITFITEAWTEMLQKKMLVPWLLTLVAYLVFYIANWLIILAVGQRISLVEIGFILSLMSLVTLIPITLAGFGTREASLIFLFAFYSITPETAIVYSLLQFIAFFLWGGIIGMICWFIKPIKFSLIKDDTKKVIDFLRPKSTK